MVCATGDQKLGVVYMPTPCPRRWHGVRQIGGESCCVTKSKPACSSLAVSGEQRDIAGPSWLSAPAAAVCRPLLKPCCKKQFWCIAHEAKATSFWNAAYRNSAVLSYQGRCPVHAEVIGLMSFAFLSFCCSVKCNPATFILSGQSGKATHSMLWTQHEPLNSCEIKCGSTEGVWVCSVSGMCTWIGCLRSLLLPLE